MARLVEKSIKKPLSELLLFGSVPDGARITVDLKDPQDVAWLANYIARADVLIQNLRPGVVEELGLGADALMARNPRLIYCSLRAFGLTGPMRLHPGYEPMVQAFSGLMMMNGDEGGPPSATGPGRRLSQPGRTR